MPGCPAAAAAVRVLTAALIKGSSLNRNVMSDVSIEKMSLFDQYLSDRVAALQMDSRAGSE
jgi:hypothetical protein